MSNKLREVRRKKYTKTGALRKGGITATAERLKLRSAFWEVLKDKLRKHVETATRGEMSRMAKTVGISQVMIHH